ncbi:hypothetical protein [Streptomyces sp. bgisy100]|uniref:hypothetical protein n=1 Tax=Streptomyces sp. bgisy100 TaxID=3413783 RepID=UPI003D74D004
MSSSAPEKAVDIPDAPPSLLNSLVWALLVPAGFATASVLGVFPHPATNLCGAVVALATFVTAVVLVSGVWHRKWAALLVAILGVVLGLCAGTGLYGLYMEKFGVRSPVVVTGVEWRGEHAHCTVVETGGNHTMYELSEQENCSDSFERPDRVTLRQDPFGMLAPRLPDRPGASHTSEDAWFTAGLFGLTAAVVCCAGLRRRR